MMTKDNLQVIENEITAFTLFCLKTRAHVDASEYLADLMRVAPTAGMRESLSEWQGLQESDRDVWRACRTGFRIIGNFDSTKAQRAQAARWAEWLTVAPAVEVYTLPRTV